MRKNKAKERQGRELLNWDKTLSVRPLVLYMIPGSDRLLDSTPK